MYLWNIVRQISKVQSLNNTTPWRKRLIFFPILFLIYRLSFHLFSPLKTLSDHRSFPLRQIVEINKKFKHLHAIIRYSNYSFCASICKCAYNYLKQFLLFLSQSCGNSSGYQIFFPYLNFWVLLKSKKIIVNVSLLDRNDIDWMGCICLQWWPFDWNEELGLSCFWIND